MFPDQANSSGREAQLRWTLLQQQAQQGDNLLKGPWLGSKVADRGQDSCLHKHGQAAWNMGPLLQQQMNQGLVVQQSNQACQSARIHQADQLVQGRALLPFKSKPDLGSPL